ncbi:MAG: DUF2828 family protein [Peptococcaceae bacterium]|jgi:hypothetical protein|nr:DUF2828 family protein [Peptococcaceae bacterium]
MLGFLKKEANKAYTENGATTYATTYSDCLDLFATVGALRRESADEVTGRFRRAYAENPDLAMKTLFFARDPRGGLGERQVFRTILRWLAQNKASSAIRNIPFIAEFGRFDDLLPLLGTPCEKVALDSVKTQLANDLAALENGGKVSLLAKWLPSVNATRAETVKSAKLIARAIGMTDAAYRKTLSRLRGHIRVIENNLRERDYTFDYAKQPSKAMHKYRKAFLRNDGERYMAFMEKVSAGEAKLHTGTLTPYEIIAPFFKEGIPADQRRGIDVTWNAQEDFTNGENALVVVDGSGSMYSGGDPLPAAVALSLGVYFAERCAGAFRNHFITFSETPRLAEIKGGDIMDKILYCHGFNEAANTNIQKVYELVLNAAVKNRVPQSELPTTLYFISDMEFDLCAADAGLANFEYAKQLFARHGYALPRIVFWNVASRNRQQPVTQNEQGAALVSGCSPRVFSMLASGKLSPYAYMMEVLGNERYMKIVA